MCSPAARHHVELPGRSDMLVSEVKRVPRSASSSRRARSDRPVILIVDDSEDNRDLFAMCLERLGYAIELAVDGVDGVERARETVPNVIVMDLAMPNMDGFEATRQIRMDPSLSSIHIVAVTAFSDAVTTQRALAAGCDAVLAKPCPPDVLTAYVETAVRGGQARAFG